MPRLTEAQLDERKTGLGSSDIAKIAGLSPWGTSLDVYAEKKGLVPGFSGNEATEWGHTLEPVLLAAYMRETGNSILPGGMVRHREHPWMFATVDAKVIGKPRIVECKLVGSRMVYDWDEHADDGVPDEVRAQGAWQLACFDGIDEVDISALLGGTKFRVFRVPLDPELQGMLIDVGAKFWRDFIVNGVEPPIDHTETCRKILEAKFPTAPPEDWIPADEPLEEIGLARLRAFETAKENMALGDRLDNELRAVIEGRTGIIGATWRAQWKNGKGGVRRYRFYDLAKKKKGAPDDE